MKYLKIEHNKGHFRRDLVDGLEWFEIDQINKNDLANLLDIATNKDFELDLYDEDLIANKAHQIIYRHLAEKFISFLANKDRFNDEADNLFKTTLEKYK